MTARKSARNKINSADIAVSMAIRDSALYRTCFWTSTLIAAPTASAANKKNNIWIIYLYDRYNKASDDNVCERERKQDLPPELHQLIVTEPGDRRTQQDIKENEHADLGREP